MYLLQSSSTLLMPFRLLIYEFYLAYPIYDKNVVAREVNNLLNFEI